MEKSLYAIWLLLCCRLLLPKLTKLSRLFPVSPEKEEFNINTPATLAVRFNCRSAAVCKLLPCARGRPEGF